MRPMTMALRTRQYGAKGGEAGREATVRLGITRREEKGMCYIPSSHDKLLSCWMPLTLPKS